MLILFVSLASISVLIASANILISWDSYKIKGEVHKLIFKGKII